MNFVLVDGHFVDELMLSIDDDCWNDVDLLR